MTGCDFGWVIYEKTREMFGRTAEPREFWLEEGEPSGVWYHTMGRFWFRNQRDCLFFYLRYHNAEG
jgi:hypothetical protein